MGERLSVAIVGAGVVGSVLAYRLAQAGYTVTVLDPGEPGGGTTSRSFAWLNGYDKSPEEYYRLNVLSIADHQALEAELGGDWLHLTGCLHWARDADPEAERMADVMARMSDWGAEIEHLTPTQAVARHEPGLRIDGRSVSTVYRLPREGWLDAPRLARAALAAAREAGATFVQDAVVDLLLTDVAVAGVILADGAEIRADVVVNAAGTDAGDIAALAGLKLSLRPAPGLMLRIRGGGDLRGVIRSSEIFLRPAAGGGVLAHLYEVDQFAAVEAADSQRRAALQALEETSKRILPSVDLTATEPVVGHRPMPADGLPVIGFDPRAPGLYTVVTHSGVTLSARVAKLVAHDLAEAVIELQPYRPRQAVGSRR